MNAGQTKASIEILLQLRHHGWTDDIQNLEEKCRSVALAALGSENGPAELSLVLADDEFVQGLNRQFRNIDKATNVLSFPGNTAIDGVPGILGDVVIAYQTASREAIEANIELVDHLSHLIVHGILHLLGYDHENDAEAGKMEGREIEILGALDIADPYT